MPSKVTTKTKRTIKTAKRKVAASRKLKTTRNMVGRAPAGTMDQLVGIEIRNLDSELIRFIEAGGLSASAAGGRRGLDFRHKTRLFRQEMET